MAEGPISKVQVRSGTASIAEGVNLYYEIRSPSSAKKEDCHKMIMLMGAFATMKHFEEQANFYVDHFTDSKTPLEVITYDHRGIGKSHPAPYVKQTSKLLAEDALALINHVWGENASSIHVFGASMGGMICQELSVRLIEAKRLGSLYLAVTSRGTFVRPLAVFTPGLVNAFMPFIIKSDREKMIRDVILPTTFSSSEATKELADRFAKIWIENYDDWFGFSDRLACSCQISAFTTHYLTNDKARTIREANIPITVQISTKDKIIPPKKQRELAKLLNAKMAVFEQGHVVIEENSKKEFFQSYISHFENAICGQTGQQK